LTGAFINNPQSEHHYELTLPRVRLFCHDHPAKHGGGDWENVRERYYSVPERIGAAGLAAAGAAALYPTIQRVTGLGLPCPLRTITGIPCPLCGMTTAAVNLSKGDAAAALAANPFVFAVLGLTITGLVLLAAREVGSLKKPAMWSPAARRKCGYVIAGLAVVSWLYQLHRLHYL
jgi:hypothetical protein